MTRNASQSGNSDRPAEPAEDPGAAALAAKSAAVFAEAEKALEEFVKTQEYRDKVTAAMQKNADAARNQGA